MSACRILCRLGLAFTLLAGCTPSAPGPVAGEEYANMPADRILDGIEHVMTSAGLRRARLLADTAYMYDDSMKAELKNVRVTFFADGGAESAELTSLTGWLDGKTEAMTARGNVVLRLYEGNRIIETAELHFDPESDRIWSDSATTLRQDGTVMYGDGFRSDGRLRSLEIVNPRGRMADLRFDL